MKFRSRVRQVALPVLVIVLFWLAAVAASGISPLHVLATSVDGLTLADYRQDPLQVLGMAPLSGAIYADAYRDALNGPHGVSWVWFSAAATPPIALASPSSTTAPGATSSPSPRPSPSTSSPSPSPTPGATPAPTAGATPTPTPGGTPTPTPTPTPAPTAGATPTPTPGGTPTPTPTPTPAPTPTPTPIDAPLTITNIAASYPQGAGVYFSDADPKGSLSQYSGTINWGDGATSGGSFAINSSGGFEFGGTHVYSGHGTFKVTVAIHDVGGASATATTSMVVP
jgi:hypothetical protein